MKAKDSPTPSRHASVSYVPRSEDQLSSPTKITSRHASLSNLADRGLSAIQSPARLHQLSNAGGSFANYNRHSPTRQNTLNHSMDVEISSDGKRPPFVTTLSRPPLPSLDADIPFSSKFMSPSEFNSSIPVFHRDRFDLFGLNGEDSIMNNLFLNILTEPEMLIYKFCYLTYPIFQVMII